MKAEVKFKDIKNRKDYLSFDKQTAISAEGEIFNIGDLCQHDDKDVGIATIQSFYFDFETMDVGVNTEKGSARISFITKI